jgi:hypothetical protein
MQLYELVRFSFQVCLIHVIGLKHVHHVHHSINLFEFVKTILVYFWVVKLLEKNIGAKEKTKFWI